MMNLQIGDKVVYPNHGVGIVEQISSRTIGPKVEKFYMLKIQNSSLKVMVPFCNVEIVGLRKVINNTDVQRILEFLVDGKVDAANADWKFRFKENSEKMRTGSLMEVAVVMKSLLELHQGKPLSFRERKMLERAKYLLVSEMALAKSADENSMEDMLVRTLAKCKLKFPEVTAEA